MQIRIGQVGDRNKISQVLSYIQGGIAEIWKDNILDEITNRMLAVQIVEELFAKIRQEFWEFDEESRKVDELRVLEQGEKTMDEYVQEFRKATRRSGYEERALVEEFKRESNRVVQRRLVEAKSSPTTIMQ